MDPFFLAMIKLIESDIKGFIRGLKEAVEPLSFRKETHGLPTMEKLIILLIISNHKFKYEGEK